MNLRERWAKVRGLWIHSIKALHYRQNLFWAALFPLALLAIGERPSALLLVLAYVAGLTILWIDDCRRGAMTWGASTMLRRWRNRQ